nr:MAG TPA: hypothetical protein [Caudoviricetes sp.]
MWAVLTCSNICKSRLSELITIYYLFIEVYHIVYLKGARFTTNPFYSDNNL